MTADSASARRTPTLPAAGARHLRLGGGVIVPYPEPTNAAAMRIARGNRRTDTKPEIRVRSAVHRRGLRFRKDYPLRLGVLRVRPDLVFTKTKIAVFIDGCFWHRCPDHAAIPRRNTDYWLPKLSRNAERDRLVDAALTDHGWLVVRVWEHEDVTNAADRIAAAIASRAPVA